MRIRLSPWSSAALALAALVLFLSKQGVPIHSAALAHPAATAGVLLLAALAVSGRFYGRLADGFERICAWPRFRFNAGLFAVALLAYASVAGFVFHGLPRVDDGMASLFQARIFARGALTLPVPPDASFFRIFAVLGEEEGLAHWCGMYPPGWPALLTPGVWLGVPWLVNPLLGALLVVTIGELGRGFYGDRTGRVAALLSLPSPFLAVLSGLHLSNVPTTLFLCLALLALQKLWANARWFWGGAAGLAWGVAFLCRPLDAVVLGAIFALGFLFPAKRLWRCRLGIAAGLAAAGLAAGTLMGFQKATTGDWQTPGHAIGMGDFGKMGFVPLPKGQSHTPELGLEHTFKRLRALNDNLLGWPVPSLLVVLLPFLLRRARVRECLLLLPMPALLLTFAFFWYYEWCFPARYLSATTPYLFLLAARGLFALREAAGSCRIAARAPAFLAVSGTLFLAVSAPFHFRPYDADYYDVEDVLPRVVRDYGISRALVFMDAIRIDRTHPDPENDYYATGFMRNDLDLEGDVIYVRNLRERNVELVRKHPERDAYLYRYHRRKGKAYLYRMVPEGEELKLFLVEPRTGDLML
ncbi:MAG: ArnT family glycosyltransferase [Kiritimatiellia bacterium]